MPHRRTTAPTTARTTARPTRLVLAGALLGVVTGAVLAGPGVASAASGGSFLLGRNNEASGQTLLKRTGNGPLLALSTRSGQVPLAVTPGAPKVTHLDVDELDGLDSSAFARATGRTGYRAVTSTLRDVTGDGSMDAAVAVATCPAGSQLTGGGALVLGSGRTVVSAPTGAAAWGVAVLVNPAVDQPGDVLAYAVCWNPRGTLPGASSIASAESAATPGPSAALTSRQERGLKAAAKRR